MQNLGLSLTLKNKNNKYFNDCFVTRNDKRIQNSFKQTLIDNN